MAGPSVVGLTVRAAEPSLFPKLAVLAPLSVVLLVRFCDEEPPLSDASGRMESFEWLLSSTAVGGGGASTPSAYTSANAGLGPLILQYSTTPTKHRKEQDTTKPALVSRVIWPLLSGKISPFTFRARDMIRDAKT